jgi:GDP-L-fucose synthase
MAGERQLGYGMENDWLNRPYSLKHKKIWVAGHKGMVGSAVVRRLESESARVLMAGRDVMDLRRQADVERWMLKNRPEVVVLAAAKVGGIGANAAEPSEFLYDNMMIEMNVINAAFRAGVEKLLFLGSSCIYPKITAQPIKEEALLTAALEPTNEPYAIAKIAGVKLCEAYRKQYNRDFVSAMPCNLYGPGDNFNPQTSHVIPALMRRAHEAAVNNLSELTVWGSGTPRREFMHVYDLADGLVFLLKNYSSAKPVNIGAGKDYSIAELANMICNVAGFKGEIVFDTSKPDGTPRKLMDSSRITKAGWRPRTHLENGLLATYQWYTGPSRQRQAA